MAHHQLKMYVPGVLTPHSKTAKAKVINMRAPLLAGELDSPDVSTPSEWLNEPRTAEPVLSPLYNITHIFDNPVKSWASMSSFDYSELQELGTFETERIIFGYFSIPNRAVFDMPLTVGDSRPIQNGERFSCSQTRQINHTTGFTWLYPEQRARRGHASFALLLGCQTVTVNISELILLRQKTCRSQ